LTSGSESEGFLLLAEVFEGQIDHVPTQLLSTRLLRVLRQISVCHLEELVDKDFDFLGHLTVADKRVGGHDTNLEEHT